MWRSLILLSLVLAGCRHWPPSITPERLAQMGSQDLCETAGIAYAMNDSQGFHLALAEIPKREPRVSLGECSALAEIGANKVAQSRADRQAFGQALANGMKDMQKAYEPKPAVTCTTISNTTNCQSH